jgi:hypothetical protein
MNVIIANIIKNNEQYPLIEKYQKINSDWILNTDPDCVFCNISLSDYIKLSSTQKITRGALSEYTDVWIYYIRHSISGNDKIDIDPWNRQFPSLKPHTVYKNGVTNLYRTTAIVDTRYKDVCRVHTTSVDGNGIYCVDTVQPQK